MSILTHAIRTGAFHKNECFTHLLQMNCVLGVVESCEHDEYFKIGVNLQIYQRMNEIFFKMSTSTANQPTKTFTVLGLKLKAESLLFIRNGAKKRL